MFPFKQNKFKINKLLQQTQFSNSPGNQEIKLAYCLLLRIVMMNSRSLAVDILKILSTCLGKIKEFK